MASLTRGKRRCRRDVESLHWNQDVDIGGGWIKEENILDVSHAPYIIRCNEQLYDQPKLYEGYIDDNQYAKDPMPYRYITNWFLSKLSESTTTRMPLPEDEARFGGLYLYGELEPNPRRVQDLEEEGVTLPTKPFRIVVTRPKCWTIDMSDSLRGIWIKSRLAWYYLKQPCANPIIVGEKAISQADLHLIFRARLGLLSNIYDMMGERYEEVRKGKNPSYLSVHKNLTPEESYSKLEPDSKNIEEHPNINSEPFDIDLLRRVPTFVRRHLANFSKELPRTCRFMVGLSSMDKDLTWAKKRGDSWALDLDNFDYLQSAQSAEQRSCRHPWGEKISKDQAPNRLNRLLEIGAPTKMDNEFNALYLLAHSKKGTDKMDESEEDDNSEISTFFQHSSIQENDTSADSDDSDGSSVQEGSAVAISADFVGDSEIAGAENVSIFQALTAVGVLADFASQQSNDELENLVGQISIKLKKMK